jgi:hypothetical protein
VNTTGIFTVHAYNIGKCPIGETRYLIPFGDIHRSSPLCHEDKWLEFLKWSKGKRNAVFLGMGDYDDLASASERRILEDDGLHDSTADTLEDFYREKTIRLAKELGYMRGRIVGLLEGNHFIKFSDGTTSTQYLCQLLKCKYLGCTSFVRLSFCLHGNVRVGLDIWAHHGKGASRLVGGSLNTVQQMAEKAEADIYLAGHDHKKSVAPITRLKIVQGGKRIRLSHRKIILARTGSFLRGYVPNKKSYVVDKDLNPTDLGVVKIEMTPRRDCSDHGDIAWIDLHASI